MSGSKSLMAKMAEAILRHTKLDFMDSCENAEKLLENPKESKLPEAIFKTVDLDGVKAYTFGDENAKNTILYIHGGAFVLEINYQHLLYCFLMSRKLDAYVIAPVYPLAPEGKATQTLELITGLYEKLISRGNLILMGDSAGGGFVYSFCQYLKTENLPQPSKIITFSPWVDVSMSNGPYDSINDLILGEVGLKEIGKSWAGDLSTSDYRVSPLFGDNTDLPDTLIFAGTGEIFYKDIEKYVENLRNDDVSVEFITGEGLFHIYPLFPIPEAWRAFKKIREIID